MSMINATKRAQSKSPLFRFRPLLLVCTLLNLAACSQADILDFITPRSGYTLTRDVSYGDNDRQKLDIYVPDALPGPAPVVIFFHGGGWDSGSKSDYRFLGQALASRGIITVVAGYRIYPEVHFPAFMEDAAQAFRFVYGRISEYKGDPGRLFLMGHSAGAHIALMLAANTSYLAQAGAEQKWIRGVIGLSGPYDFLPFTDPDVIAVFSKAKDHDTQPINYLHAGMPPMLLASGDDDDTVGLKNTVNVARRQQELGNPVEIKIYPGVGHLGIVLAIARGFRFKAPVLDDMVSFIEANP